MTNGTGMFLNPTCSKTYRRTGPNSKNCSNMPTSWPKLAKRKRRKGEPKRSCSLISFQQRVATKSWTPTRTPGKISAHREGTCNTSGLDKKWETLQAFFFGANALESTRVKCWKIEFLGFKIEFFCISNRVFGISIQVFRFESRVSVFWHLLGLKWAYLDWFCDSLQFSGAKKGPNTRKIDWKNEFLLSEI